MRKNYFYNVLVSLANILFPILSFPYASRVLGPDGIGKVQFTLSFAQYFALFATLGIPIYGVKEIAKNRNDRHKLQSVFTELVTINFVSGIILSIIYFIIVYQFHFFTTYRELLLFASLLVILSFSSTDWFFSGIENFKIIAVRSVVIKIIALILLYTLVKNENDYLLYLCITIFSTLGYQVISFFTITKKVPLRFTNIRLKQHFVPIIYIFSATIASSIYTVFDTVILGFLSNNTAVGFYTAAVKLVKITIPFITSMGVILMPSITHKLNQNNLAAIDELLSKSFHFLIVFSIPVSVGLAILAPEFIAVFSGEKFMEASLSMQILAALPMVIGFGHFLSFQFLIPAEKNKQLFLSMLCGVIVSLLLNFILVPTWHETGAAIANTVAEIAVTAAYFYFIRQYHRFVFDKKIILQSIISSLIFLPVVWLIRHFQLNNFYTLTISVLLCILAYLFLQITVFKNSYATQYLHLMIAKLKGRKLKNE
jgi:O-antigen/teichoic acid export membrane protein